jgi:hypothetical protein
MNKNGRENRMQRNRRPQQRAHQLAGNAHIREIERVIDQQFGRRERAGSRTGPAMAPFTRP